MFKNMCLDTCGCCLAALFEEGDVCGQHMFGFQTPKGKGALTPRTPKTPQSRKVNGTPHTSNQDIRTAKTPYSLRKRLKKSKWTF
jgi:hypothetical protein